MPPMNVRLMNGQVHPIEPDDLAYLYQHYQFPCSGITSRDMFHDFELYMERHSLNYDPEPINEWDRNFIENFISIEDLNNLMKLAKRTGQDGLVELCQQRITELQDDGSDTDSENDDDDTDDDDDTGGDDDDDTDGDDDDDDDDDTDDDDTDGENDDGIDDLEELGSQQGPSSAAVEDSDSGSDSD